MTKQLIVLLDASGSMGDDNKWENAKLGVAEIWEQDFGVKKLELISIYRNAITPEEIPSSCGGGTPLYQKMGKLLENLQTNLIEYTLIPTVVAIFTDGMDTEGCYSNWPIPKMKQAINLSSNNGVAFTFLGIPSDVSKMNELFGISEENSKTHDNTGAGFSKSISEFQVALDTYSKDIDAGVANTRGFYKSIK